MKKTLVVTLVVLFAACCSPVRGQRKDSLSFKKDAVLSEFDSLFNSQDSVSILRLIDSLILVPELLKEASKMAIRLGYNSNVVATGRTLGFNQFGLAPGVSYYHKTGLYADATAYWSQQYSPNVYLTVLSGGYMKTAFKHWSFLAEYSRYLYSAAGSGIYSPYTNNLGATNYFKSKFLSLRLDYYFYFGQKSAHRIMPGIILNLEKKKWLGLDRVSFFPSFTLLYGSENVTSDYIFYPDVVQRVHQNQSLPANAQLPLFYTKNENVFGLMNYSFSAPLSITRKNWNLLVSYTYNIPKSLPHEDLGLKNGGYVSFSITRYLNF